MKIVRNAIMCAQCGDVIVSAHRHDFKTCHCGSVSVDGGQDYLKRTGKPDSYYEACVYAWGEGSVSFDKETPDKFIVYSPEGKTNPNTLFDRYTDAKAVAKEMSKNFPGGTWFVASLSFVDTKD